MNVKSEMPPSFVGPLERDFKKEILGKPLLAVFGDLLYFG